MSETIVCWFKKDDKGAPREPSAGKAKLVIDVACTTDEWDAWDSAGRNGDAPARYRYVSVWAFDEGVAEFIRRVYAMPRGLDDPRQHVVFRGKWGTSKERDYNGKHYVDLNFWADAAAALKWSPMTKRGER